MSAIYAAARSAFLQGELDVVNDALKMVMVGPGYTYDEAHDNTSDLTNVIGVAVPVSVNYVLDGRAVCDPVTFVAVPDGATIAGLVTYADATGLLIAYADRRADAVPLNPLAGTGGDLTFNFVDYLLKI